MFRLDRLALIFDGAEKRGLIVFGWWVGILRLWFFDFMVLAFGIADSSWHGVVRLHYLVRYQDGVTDMDALGINSRIGFG